MEKSKKVRMPGGIRNKLMAAVAMLLVSSIMMVTSTYAWFTLSTAPEVTGITTSVGANGNLEIALLTTETFANPSSITSAVGDSSAVKEVKLSNITWGNLVDLSDSSYGLTGIALMPAALNGTSTINTVSPLLTAVYGADGRVATTDGPTVSAVASANGAFTVGDTQTYGVRAVGVTSNLSVREIAFKNAKSAVNSVPNSAKAGTKSAIYSHMAVLLKFATASETPTSYSDSDIAAFRDIANGVIADLAVLENGYKNAALAKAASAAADDEAFAAVKTLLEPMTLSQLITNAGTYGMTDMTDAMTALATAQTAAAEAKTALDAATSETAADTVKGAINKLVDNFAKSEDGTLTVVHIQGGAVGELGAQLGVFEVASVGSLGKVYAGKADVTVGSYNTAVTYVNGLPAPAGSTTDANITDTYGYIIDFAFRTNAADSSLQLQTSAVNRVYSDAEGTDLATQGAGSTVTYVYNPDMTVSQVNALLGAIKLVFMDTNNGTVYATAGLTEISVNDSEATAKVKLDGQAGDVGTIVALNQNVAKTISVMVYLDGNSVDNADVANAASSGVLNLNLQFSSSANLIPMQNTALQNMTAYTVSFDANGGVGYMPDVRATANSYVLPAVPTFTAPTGKQFKGWATDANGTAMVTTVTEAATVYAIWENIPETPAVESYEIAVTDEGNVLESKPTTAKAGETVTLTAVDGKTFGSVKVFNGEDVEMTEEQLGSKTNAEGTSFSFTMPAHDISITVTAGS